MSHPERAAELAPSRVWTYVFVGATGLCAAVFALYFASMLQAGELFHRFGFDWTMFYAQAMALRDGGGRAMYELAAMDGELQRLSMYYTGTGTFQTAQPVPYPPWFAAMVLPFTLPGPPVGSALWEAASLAAALVLAFRARQFLPGLSVAGAVLALLAAAPIATNLYMGQVGLLLGVPVAEMLISFRAARDVRAGVWLSVLFIKPQYAVLFALLILWKRRFAALAGLVLGGLIFVLVGLLIGGPTAFVGMVSALGQMGQFRGDFGGPWWMLNWRSIVLAVRPGISDELGIGVVVTLSLITMIVSLVPFRGRWDPLAPTFAPAFCVLTLGAVLSSYHSHLHGAALLAVPLAAAWAAPTFGPLTRVAMVVAVYLPSVWLLWIAAALRHFAVSGDTDVPLWYVWPNPLPATLFVLAFALMSFDLLPSATRWLRYATRPPAVRASA